MTSQLSRGLGRALTGMLLALIAVNVSLLCWLAYRTLDAPALEAEAAGVVPKIELKLPAPAPGQEGAPPVDLADSEKRLIQVFHDAAPSVVFITTHEVRRSPYTRNVLTLPAGTGSGFVWDDKGHVVTNFHVIKDASIAHVALSDQTTYNAELVGQAPEKDIAVLRIKAPADKLRALSVGSSKELRVGQLTIAIGNPFGLDHTLSTGVVSGLGREIRSLADVPIFGVIQTDAAINPGNSGGPLLDSRGKLIGMNTAIYSPSGASAGIGFAVPVDTISRVVPQLIEHGKLIRPGLGIQHDPQLSQRTGVPGVLVLGVIPQSGADEAGIRGTERNPITGEVVLGDIITAIDGKPVQGDSDLYKHLDDKQVGDSVKVTVRRGESSTTLTVKLTSIAE
jgi:S1-C subfamily serine protease